MVVNLTSFQAKADESVLGVRIVNGADKDVDLDWSDHKTFWVAGRVQASLLACSAAESRSSLPSRRCFRTAWW